MLHTGKLPIQKLLETFRIEKEGSKARNGEENLLISLAALMSFGGLVWGTLLVYFRIYDAAFIPYGYVVLSLANILILVPRNLVIARSAQVMISMLLPFALQWMLGGFFSSGVVMLWSTLALVGSITLLRGKYVYPWLIFFLILSLFSFWIEPYVHSRKPDIITDQISILMLIINVLMISTIVFILAKNKVDRSVEITGQLESANNELEKHKNKLESIVQVRTEELQNHIELLKIIQADMQVAKEEAEKANEAKSQFLANMSHEIRSPLNAILGFSQIMSMNTIGRDVDPEFKQYLDNIKLSGQNLLELINNILDLSKIEAGKVNLSIETVHIKQLFKGIYQINKVKAEEKQIEFSYDISSNVPDFIESDRTKLNQILMNLVTNAIKFTPPTKRVTMNLSMDGRDLVMNVIDTGVGIEQERITQIFEPFVQADNSITRRFGGTGLGLTITKKMTQVLNGTINVYSIPGVGSTFSVKLPLRNLPLSNEVTAEQSEPIPAQLKKSTVLIVEDNELNQQLLVTFLKQVGLQTVQAYNGKEGIEKAMEHRPALIIMDIHMPVMDGLECTKILRSIPEFKQTPIICLTADAFTNQQKKAFAVGVNEYLTKPVDLDALLAAITKYI